MRPNLPIDQFSSKVGWLTMTQSHELAVLHGDFELTLTDTRHFRSDDIAIIRRFDIRQRSHVGDRAIVLVGNHCLLLWRLGRNIHCFVQGFNTYALSASALSIFI